MARRSRDEVVFVGLHETYHQKGEYSFKIVFSQDKFHNCHDVSVEFIDPSGSAMSVDVKRWGRKMVCSFCIDDRVPDGVVAVRLTIGTKKVTRSFWVIK